MGAQYIFVGVVMNLSPSGTKLYSIIGSVQLLVATHIANAGMKQVTHMAARRPVHPGVSRFLPRHIRLHHKIAISMGIIHTGSQHSIIGIWVSENGMDSIVASTYLEQRSHTSVSLASHVPISALPAHGCYTKGRSLKLTPANERNGT